MVHCNVTLIDRGYFTYIMGSFVLILEQIPTLILCTINRLMSHSEKYIHKYMWPNRICLHCYLFSNKLLNNLVTMTKDDVSY